MECADNPEREENINTVEELQNTKVNMGYIPKMNLSRKQNSCDQCEFIGSHTGLWHHKKSKHEGVRYPCDQCEYVATRVLDLKRHKESKHEEGIIYPCDKCDYVATVLANLKRHKKSKHEGVKFTCDQCEYAATRYDYLKIHKKKKHSIVSTVATKVKNDRVKIEKIDARKYQISPDGHTILDPVVIDISNKNRAVIKSSSMDISDFQVKKENGDDIRNMNRDKSYTCDLQTKIEIEEDLTLKTESSDLSEFLDPSYESSIKESIHSNVTVSTTEIKKEENFVNYDISDLCKSESDTFDLQTKIEIEEDMVLKTESSDLSEFQDPTYEESCSGVVTSCVHDELREEDEDIRNPVTTAE